MFVAGLSCLLKVGVSRSWANISLLFKMSEVALIRFLIELKLLLCVRTSSYTKTFQRNIVWHQIIPPNVTPQTYVAHDIVYTCMQWHHSLLFAGTTEFGIVSVLPDADSSLCSLLLRRCWSITCLPC